MGLDDHPKLTEDLVLHIWEAITVIGNARGRSEEFGESGVEVVLVQAEAILLAIVSEVARCVGQSTRQPRRWARFGKAAHGKLSYQSSWSGSCRTLPTPSYPASGGAGAMAAPTLIPSKSSRCASAATSALTTISNFSSWVRFHRTSF